jgi:hypothetical protein
MITYNDVNNGMKQVKTYLESIENVWNESRNLKLYDVAFQAGDILEKYPLVKEEYKEDDLFTWFCEYEYECFTEWMNENNIDDCRSYIGRTSSFYLTDIHDDSIEQVIYNLFDKILGYYPFDIDVEALMIPFQDTDYYTEAELIEEYQEDMEYIANGKFLQDIKDYLSDAVQIADYIDTFKKNQIAGFTEYIECKNDDLEYQAEQDAKEEQAFMDKYADAITDIAKAIQEVIEKTGCTMSEAIRIIGKAKEQIEIA